MSGRQSLPPATDKPQGDLAVTAAAPALSLDSKSSPANQVAKSLSVRNLWPAWRGPTGQGLSTETDLPVQWSATSNIAWKVSVPGRGHSSPVVWGDRVVLTSAQDAGRTRHLTALSRTDGRLLWTSSVTDPDPGPIHSKHDYASSTPITNGRVVVCFFGNAGLFGFDLTDGRQLWNVPLGPFSCVWGTASSPVLISDEEFALCVDDDSSCFVAAYRIADGRQLWRTDRDQDRSFSTPLLVNVGDNRRELVINGKGRVWAYDPATGQPLWLCNGTTVWVTPTIVAGQGMVFASSGRLGPTLAIRPGGRGDVTATHLVWKAERGSPYIPSPILVDDLFYMVNDGGILIIHDARTGELVTKRRLGGDFTASPVAGDGKIYFTNESGDTFVVKAGRTGEVLSTNSLADRCLASAAIAGGQIFLRGDNALYCIGSSQTPALSEVSTASPPTATVGR